FQGAGRARDDRRPGAERSRPRRGHRLGRGRGPRAAREPSHRPPSGVAHRSAPARRHRPHRAPARDVPRRIDHGSAEAPRDGDHRGAGAVGAGALHRRHRALSSRRRSRARAGHPDGHRRRGPSPLSRGGRHRHRLGSRARARRGVAQDRGAAPRARRGDGARAAAVLVWLNGRWLAAEEARVSALDRGLLHGDGVYDTWRTYDGRPFAVALHVRRLAAAARRLGLPPPGPPALWERRSRLLVARNHLADAAVRLTLTRGAAGETLVPQRRRPPTLLLTMRPLPADLAARQRDGVGVVVLTFPRDAAPAWGWLKLIGHPGAVLGRSIATRHGAAEALYVNGAREVTEATTANVFICERDALVTPPLSAGVLPGVTRA